MPLRVVNVARRRGRHRARSVRVRGRKATKINTGAKMIMTKHTQ